MSDVEVSFGANITKLVDGIAGVKSEIGDIREAATSLAEAFGIAFSVEGLKDYVEGMAELGAHTESVAATLGASNQQTVELAGIAKLTGTSLDELAGGIERMSLNIQRSTKDGTSPAAQALAVLHLNASELIGLPADQYFEKLATAVAKFNPSLNLTNALMAVGGRGIAQLLPTLLQGGEHWEEFKAKVDQASEGLAAAVPGMADTDEKLKLLGISVESASARIFTVLKPAIDDAVEAFTRWAQSIKSDDITSAVLAIGNGMITLAEEVATAFAGLGGQIDIFKGKLTDLAPHLTVTLTGEAATVARFVQNITDDQWTLLQKLRDEAGKPIKFNILGTDEGAAAGATATVAENIDKIHASAEAARAALAGMFPPAGSGAAIAQDFLAIQKGVQDTIAAYQKLNATPINMGGGDQLKAAMDQYQGMIKAADEEFRSTQEHLGAEAKLHEITYAQETQQLLAALDVRRAAEEAATDSELALYARGSAGYEKVLAERKEQDAKYFADRQKIVDQSAEHEAQAWKSAADQIAGAINGQLQKILSGHENLKQALQNISGQIALKFIEDQIKVTVEWLTNQARILAGHIAGEAGMTAATTAGTAARSAAEVASGEASIFSVIANAIKSIAASGGQTAAEVTAQVAPVAGPAAPAIGAAAGAVTIATGMSFIGGIAGAEIGGYVVKGGLVNVHDDETIVPARMNQPYQGGDGGGGDTHIHMHNPNFSGQANMQKTVGQLSRVLAQHRALTPSQTW
jgi:hypothetical protein